MNVVGEKLGKLKLSPDAFGYGYDAVLNRHLLVNILKANYGRFITALILSYDKKCMENVANNTPNCKSISHKFSITDPLIAFGFFFSYILQTSSSTFPMGLDIA